jgi:WD40 repeat protein
MVFNNDKSTPMLAVASTKGTVHLFDLKDGMVKSSPSIADSGIYEFSKGTTMGTEARSFNVVRLAPAVSSVLAFSSDSKSLITLGYDGIVRFWIINRNAKEKNLIGIETAADCEKDITKEFNIINYLDG